MKKLAIFLVLMGGVFCTNAQNYFKNYRNGETFFKNKNYPEAITEFTKVVELKIDHDRAFNYLGLCNLELKNYDEAEKNFKKATEIKPKEDTYFYGLGESQYHLKKFADASVSFNTTIDLNKKNMEAYNFLVKSYMALKSYQKATEVAQNSVEREKSWNSYIILAIAQDSLMNYKDAVYNYGRAKFYDAKPIENYIGTAHAYSKLNDFEKANEAIGKALSIDKNNTQALLLRSDISLADNHPQKAIDDISIVIVNNPDSICYLTKRGNLFQKIGQYQNAVSDYTNAIKINKKDYFLYYKRAKLYELLTDYKSAISDYNIIKKIAPYDGNAQKLYDDAKTRLYELNRESNNPTLVMIDPISPKEGIVQMAKNKDYYLIKGQIKDESNIDFIKINGKDATYNKDTLNPFFQLDVKIKDLDNFSITAFDIYHNSETWNFKIEETEINPPEVKLLAPYASDDGSIYLDSDDPSIYVEGNILDESLIKSILIDGTSAAFNLSENNPKFSATINIMNKDEFTVTATDIYGNTSTKNFKINRENVALLADNPMGKTWVIFIENSDYNTFASLEGPDKDITMMKSAFAKYKINNFIQKKNMTKAQLEKFFAIELRDLIKGNRVNSILVWYAGHGKFINNTGYWIPIDATRDDEFTYFNINNLKASMQSYSKYITHTLVVTDACESGPSFYQAMRSIPEDKSCNDWKATKFKSSQVFSSAGYELASDNSQFTKTFANTLNSNPNSCIPIETVVKKVTTAVNKSGVKQKPEFGKIAGLEDENGTFFFIKK